MLPVQEPSTAQPVASRSLSNPLLLSTSPHNHVTYPEDKAQAPYQYVHNHCQHRLRQDDPVNGYHLIVRRLDTPVVPCGGNGGCACVGVLEVEITIAVDLDREELATCPRYDNVATIPGDVGNDVVSDA